MVGTRRPFRRSSPENAARDGAGRATLTAARRPGRRARKAPLRLPMKSPRRGWRPSRRPSTYQMNAPRSVTFAGRAGSFWRTANAVTRIALLAENADAEPVSLPNHGRNGYEVVAHALGVAHGFNAVRRGADDGPEMISARGLARNSLFGDVRAIARRPITASAFRGDCRGRGALARPLAAAWATARCGMGLGPRKAANHRGSTAVRCAAVRVSLAARGPTGLTRKPCRGRRTPK